MYRRKDMEAELLSVTSSLASMLQQGQAEAATLATDVRVTADKAQRVCLSLSVHLETFFLVRLCNVCPGEPVSGNLPHQSSPTCRCLSA